MKRIAVMTSGGDAPGMNAAIRAVTRTAVQHGIEVLGIRQGFAGLMKSNFVHLSARDVGGIIEIGGTILESARSHEFRTPEGKQKAVAALADVGAEGVIVIGGNGSQTGALSLSELGVAVNGVASTIDNDLPGSEITIGVDTAMNTALDAIDRLRTTASSLGRVFVVEVMGRDCGYLALAVGIAGGAEVVVCPESPVPIEKVIERINQSRGRGKRYALIVVAEGVKGYANCLHQALISDQACAEFDSRLTVLGHVQRGGRPSAFDRLLATRLAASATERLIAGETGMLVGLIGGAPAASRLRDVLTRSKPLPAELIQLADTMRI